ncbi:TMhelix containing protein [Vibrio phage 1.249.A._10N.261.55.B9]|uniref:TMhelix containing protein n=2 Tax=Autolykiviridae TaxID=2184034 RepID=A0A2I7RXF2_9VIRU|nr:TMhelix containing protein [Vibrio phage 1.249.A._10N.261.55.B9]AUR98307.1 TMhelix containing protein [Vibrio phage 1.249.A._10N.261.55.B9]AUR98329.1 TMhelix containing protein [Vibrio phage 1.249.B._10N.261.55.B9]
MPLILLPLLGGALLGGGTVWIATDTAKKVTTAALIGGALYLYMKRGK